MIAVTVTTLYTERLLILFLIVLGTLRGYHNPQWAPVH